VHRFPISLDEVPVAALLADLDGTVVAASTTAISLVGDVVGTELSVVVPDVAWAALLAAAEPTVVDTQVVTAEGGRPLQLTISRVVVDQRTLACVLLTGGGERDPQTQQRLDSLGLVAGGIAHDFNNLLVGVLAESSAAREDRDLSETTREALRRIEAAARRMAQLTRQLLAFAGRAQVVTVPIDADELVGELHEELSRLLRPDVGLHVTPGASGAVVEGDRGLLRQVVINLVSNASDAAVAKVVVTTQVIARDAGPYWQLEVGDDGLGIDPSALPRIFEPFFSTKSGHHGLGLSAVHGIVRRLGGEVEVDSRVGGGARFRVRLPIVLGAEPAPRVSREILIPTSQLVGIHALVADDEPSVRATVRRLLERRGAKVVVASDGSEAEARLRAEPGTFQLVVTDVAMPGYTGYEVLEIARDTQPGVCVVLMSGYTEMLRGTGSEFAPDAFLEKPFTAKALDHTIDEVLKGKR